MTTPSLAGSYSPSGNWTTGTSPKTQEITAAAAGDLVVVLGGTAASSTTLGTPSGGPPSWALEKSEAVSGYCPAYAWAGVMTSSLTVTTGSLPAATEGTAYSATLAASGGTGTGYTWAVSSGALPSWASLGASTGVISGTPPEAAAATDFTVEVTDSGGNTATAALSITVSSGGGTGAGGLAVTTLVTPTGQVSQAYSATLAASGGTGTGYVWAVTSGSLPAGLSLTASTGVISGTPTAAATPAVTVGVTDSDGNTASQAMTMTVITGPSASLSGTWDLAFADEFNVAYPTPYGSGPNPNVWADHYINGDMERVNNLPEQEWYPHGYYGHAVSDSIWTLTATYQDPQDIDPTCPSPLQDGGETGTFTAGMGSGHLGAAFTYGYIEMRMQYPSPASGWLGGWMITRDNVWPPEIDISELQPPSHSGQRDSGYDTTAGSWDTQYTTADTDWHAYGCLLTESAVTFYVDGTEFFSTAYDGNAYAWFPLFDFAVEGASNGSGYPAGLQIDYCRVWVPGGAAAAPVITSISPVDGIASGGDIEVSFGTVSGATSYRVTASPADSLADGWEDGNPTERFTATGSSSPLTVTGLPSGIRFNFTVCAINSAGYSMESLPAGPQIVEIQLVTTVLPAATEGTAYSATLEAAAGNPPYTWSISSGSLPGGLTLDASTGVISGTPTGTGTSDFTATVAGDTDWSGGTTAANSASAALTITVGASSVQPVGPSGSWNLVFNATFEGDTLDSTVWASGGGVTVSGGCCVLEMDSEGDTAIIDTYPSLNGYTLNEDLEGQTVAVGDCCEAYISFAGPSGDTAYNHPAWWISGADWPANGEIDIFESYNGTPSALNYHSSAGANNGPFPSGDWCNSFHTYTCVRGADSVEVYWDGVLVRTVTPDDDGGPMSLIVTIGTGNTAATGATSAAYVSYVRVWSPA